MVRDIDVLAEIRKHPGIASGVVAVLAGVGLATLLLNQRTGPTRLESLRGRFDPRGWFDVDDLRGRFDDLADTLKHGLHDAGERAHDMADDARHRGDRLFRDARHASRRSLKRGGKVARQYADEAGQYARDHAREGGALLALATIAAVIGAAALESRRPDSRLRGLLDR